MDGNTLHLVLLTRITEIALLKGLLGSQQGLPLPSSSICPSCLLPSAFSSFFFATVHFAHNSQTDLPGTPLTSGCSLDHRSQLISHCQVQSPLHLPCRTLSHWHPLSSSPHASSPTAREHAWSGCTIPTHAELFLFAFASAGSPLLDALPCLSSPGGIPHYYVELFLL